MAKRPQKCGHWPRPLDGGGSPFLSFGDGWGRVPPPNFNVLFDKICKFHCMRDLTALNGMAAPLNITGKRPRFSIGISSSYLEDHLDGEYPRECVVEVCEHVVPLRVLLDGVLRGQRDRGQDDHHHDERLEERERHDAVHEDADAEGIKKKEKTEGIKKGSRSPTLDIL